MVFFLIRGFTECVTEYGRILFLLLFVYVPVLFSLKKEKTCISYHNMSHQRKTNTLLTKASTILIESSRQNWIEKEIASIQITKYIHFSICH